jgi:heme oxygenase
MFSRLKQDTQSLHLQLEATVDIERRLLSIDSYRDLLVRFYGFYAPLESRLAEIAGIEVVGFQTRRKLPLLQSDLLYLGIVADDLPDLPRCADLPALDDVHAAFGCLYVIEGSTLGGQLIARQLHALGVDADCGAAFFNSYRENVGMMWLNFKRTVEAQVRTGQEEDRTIASARQTFIKLHQWLQAEAQPDVTT